MNMIRMTFVLSYLLIVNGNILAQSYQLNSLVGLDSVNVVVDIQSDSDHSYDEDNLIDKTELRLRRNGLKISENRFNSTVFIRFLIKDITLGTRNVGYSISYELMLSQGTILLSNYQYVEPAIWLRSGVSLIGDDYTRDELTRLTDQLLDTFLNELLTANPD
ncbi:MAG: hypothetical protein ED557_05685 [Balneola sp.]|nr:MAG: hypothetical protein ED557_05685 [Balneola sp.]